MLANVILADSTTGDGSGWLLQFLNYDVFLVLVYALVSAVTTGLGVVPFLFFKDVGSRSLGFGNAVASGLMLGASIGLIWESVQISAFKMSLGLVAGFLLIWVAKMVFPESEHEEDNVPDSHAKPKNVGKMFLIMVVMTIHSFAEGIGIGVSFGGREGLGELISVAIALHNIPEGLAIGLVMIPRGVSVKKAFGWSVFSSLPQPLMAVPAFLFVNTFQAFLPVGLAIAAGAMFYMVYRELLPEAFKNLSTRWVYVWCLSTLVAMIWVQFLMM